MPEWLEIGLFVGLYAGMIYYMTLMDKQLKRIDKELDYIRDQLPSKR